MSTYTTNGLDKYYSDNRFSSLQGQGISIAILDTGIDLDHSWFGPDNNNDGVSDRIKISTVDMGITSTDNSVQDYVGHGTAVAGVIAAIAPKAGIVPIQVSSDTGGIITTSVDDGLDWVSNNIDKYNIRAVNLSLSDAKNWKQDDDSVFITDKTPNELREITSRGATVFGSAGNFYEHYKTTGLGHLAAHYTTIGSMATNSNGLTSATNLATWSQRRSDALAAPGQGLTTAKLNGSTSKWQGTSFSSPFMAGASLLLQSVAKKYMGRYLTSTEMATTLQETSIGVGNSGYKEIDIYGAAEHIYNKLNSIEPPANNIVKVDLSKLTPYALNRPEINSNASYSVIRSAQSNKLSLAADTAVMTTTKYDITEDSLLSFEYRHNGATNSANQWAKLLAMGVDTNSTFAKYTKIGGTGGERVFSLNDVAINSLNTEYEYTAGSNTWQKFEIPVGDYLSGQLNLVFYNDFGTSEFKNVAIV